jgi:hypothetical protein
MSVPIPLSVSKTPRRAAVTMALCLSLSAQAAQFLDFEPIPGQGTLRYYSSQTPGRDTNSALIVLHGHPRDAQRTFKAGVSVQGAGLVIAPLFQVDTAHAGKCHSPGEPAAQPGDLLWSCSSWLAGAPALNAPQVSAFKALDGLISEVQRRWPNVRTITIAGFSAGAQMVQHYIGFAADAPSTITLRYVVADPGTWLYFNAQRPYPVADCPGFNHWKYGTAQLPDWLNRSAAEAQRRYRAADIHYLEGELDDSPAKGNADRLLDRSCAAMAQGPFRRQRGQAYAVQDARPLQVVPGCGHSVTCVFAAPEARQALLGQP